jgi:hypothetical protein
MVDFTLEEIAVRNENMEKGENPSVAGLKATDNSNPPSPTCTVSSSNPGRPTSSSSTCISNDDDDLPPSGVVNNVLNFQQKVEHITAVFPSIPMHVIKNAVLSHIRMNSAVNVLLQYRPGDGSGESSTSQESSGVMTHGETVGIQNQKLFLRYSSV